MSLQFAGPLEERIAGIIGPSLDDMGYGLVRVRMMGQEGRNTLQIMIDRKDETDITIDDCEAASRQISALMDVEDPVSSEYTLEVSSPGVDRPLTRLRDFERFAGFETKLSAHTAIDGRKHFRGELKGIKENLVLIDVPGMEQIAEIPFAEISTSKLVLTDELLKSHAHNDNT